MKPLTMTPEQEAGIRSVLDRAPDHVNRNAKSLLAELDAIRAQKAKDDAEHAALEADYAAVVRALHGLVWKCHVADCNEDLGDVDFSDEWNMLARCEECDGHGTKDKLPHEDESIEPENVCPACGGMVILPVLAPSALSVKEEG